MALSAKFQADDKKAGISLKEVIDIIEHAKYFDPEKTFLRTGATGLKGQVRSLELVQED